MNVLLVIVLGATFAAVTSLFLLGLSYWSRYSQQIDDRLMSLSARAPAVVSKKIAVKRRKTPEERAKTTLARLAMQLLPNGVEGRQRLQTQLFNAGIYSPNALPMFLGTKVFLSCAPPAIGVTLGLCGWTSPYVGLFWGSLAGAIGLSLPSLWLRQQKRKWHSTILRSLSDFLDLMVACLEVGLSSEAAMQRVTAELQFAHPRLWVELNVVQAQIELGTSSDAALMNFAERSGCEAVRSLASVMQQGRRLGGGMAEVFRQQAESLRTRREYAIEEMAQQAAVKILIPTLLFVFPVIFVVLAGPAVIKVAGMFTPKQSQNQFQ